MRPANAEDRRDVLALLERTLGWEKDSRYEAFFTWKHEQNVFGPSPAWVAQDGERIVGFRAFLRWEFELDGTTIRAVRAVDTATDPDYRRRGVFRRLTLHALREIDGTGFVFNTPNDQSRPGYIRMGWQTVGRIPVAARPAAPRGLVRMASARAPAELWSAKGAGGEAASAVLAEGAAISALLSAQPPASGMATRRSVDYLRWRYGFPPLDYRTVALRGDVTAGMALFRVRCRGSAREAALCELFAPEGDAVVRRRLVREVARTARADYVLRVSGARDGCIMLPRQGPVLTMRPLQATAPRRPRDWALTLGDVELL